MSYYITADGGGSKLNAVLFDDALNIISRSHTGGVNTSQNSPEAVERSLSECVDNLLGSADGGCAVDEIEAFYSSFVGPVQLLTDAIEARVPIRRKYNMGEGDAGMLASAARFEGLLAISGTGSDVFYITRTPPEGVRTVVGAYGPILGDDGSGVWMGQQALRAAIRYSEGWGEPTLLLQLIRDGWRLSDDFGMVPVVHGSPSPFRTVGSVTPIVGQAARMGDAVAQRIITQAAELMAEQTDCLLRRIDVPAEHRYLAVCGGAWKVDPLMFDTYKALVTARHPDVEVHRPLFEHVMAGPVRLLLERGMERAEVVRRIGEKFSDYIICI